MEHARSWKLTHSRTRMLFTVTAALIAVITVCTTGGFLSGISGIREARAAGSLRDGANISPASSTDFGSPSFDASLKNLAATGANYVTLNIPLYQSNVSSIDVQNNWNTPTAQSLTGAIQYAHSLGLHVMLKFNVYPGDGQWSAYINPSDRDGWFNAYLNEITPFIKIAQSNGVEEICLGDELIDMATSGANQTNTAHWNSLISSVRAMYPGRLTYDANWGGDSFGDEKDHIDFWSSLDDISISAYFNLTGDGSVASLMQSWASWDASDVQPLAAKWNKPIIFGEIGYMSIHDSYTHPWMWWESGTPDEAQQANDYQALFQYWDQRPYFAGVEIWNWSSDPNAGGPNNSDYTPQGKTAQSVMQQFFSADASGGSSGGSGGGSGSTGGAAPAFTTHATAAPSSIAPGANTTLNVTVTNSGGTVSGANVDMEIYNSSGAQVFQKIFTGQTINAGASAVYSFGWSAPSSAGAYTLKTGIFNGSWSQEYYWGNDVLSIGVGTASGSGGGGTPSSPGTINIWWPTDGVTVTGVQPFKAMLVNMSVNDYAMYWQVDGGQLNPMQTNNTDYPHKEASVDVASWTWRGNGPYVVTFVAKDPSGNVIATAKSTIYN